MGLPALTKRMWQPDPELHNITLAPAIVSKECQPMKGLTDRLMKGYTSDLKGIVKPPFSEFNRMLGELEFLRSNMIYTN
jgi:hypothetical protein